MKGKVRWRFQRNSDNQEMIWKTSKKQLPLCKCMPRPRAKFPPVVVVTSNLACCKRHRISALASVYENQGVRSKVQTCQIVSDCTGADVMTFAALHVKQAQKRYLSFVIHCRPRCKPLQVSYKNSETFCHTEKSSSHFSHSTIVTTTYERYETQWQNAW